MTILQQLKANIVTCGIYLSVIILLANLPMANMKFILLGGLIASCVIYLSVKRSAFSFIKADIFWLGFVFLGLLSFTWSIDRSLIWYSVFGWSLILSSTIVFRSLIVNRIIKIKSICIILILLFYVSFLQNILAVQFNLLPTDGWNQFMSNNKNYTTSHLVVLLPFLLFFPFKQPLLRFLKFVCTVLLLNLLYITNARGALLTCVIVIIFYLTFNTRKFLSRKVSIVLVTFIAIGLFIINYSFPFKDLPILNLYYKELGSRFYLLTSSLILFFENPIQGVGIGNWGLNAYRFNLEGIAPFDNVINQIRFRSHNLYTLLLAESGILGLLFLFFPVVFTLYKSFSTINQLSNLKKGALGTLCAYLILSFFYTVANFHQLHFSSIHLLAFISIGILSTDFEMSNQGITKSPSIIVIFAIAVSSLGYFVYQKYSWNNFHQAKVLIAKGDNANAITILEKNYSSNFNSSFSIGKSYPQLLSSLYAKTSNTKEAKIWFEESIRIDPYNLELRIGYADFLLENNIDVELSKSILLEVYDIHPRNCRLNIMLSRSWAQTDDIKEAKSYFEKIDEKCKSVYDQDILELESNLAL